jgi:hypothetical protein
LCLYCALQNSTGIQLMHTVIDFELLNKYKGTKLNL